MPSTWRARSESKPTGILASDRRLAEAARRAGLDVVQPGT
jgi:hypothetical protein